MKSYNHKTIEPKWQKRWDEAQIFAAKNFDSRPKFYGLIEFPYPSGEGLHVGHPRSYTAMDIIARQRRMAGNNVLYPIGFDSFGLPTENYAIKTGRPPAEITRENIANFTRQLKSIGFSFDWSRVVITSEPEYYQWTQWIFLQLFKHGLAYKKKQPINWCSSCKIGLANEEVVDGKCERCGTPVEQRNKEQWMLAITKYADKLLAGLDTVDYIERAKVQQQNWIGRSEGAEIEFLLIARGPTRTGTRTNADQFLRKSASSQRESATLTSVKVFTTRPDTLFGVTYLVLAPEHELIAQLQAQISNWPEVQNYIEQVTKKSEQERMAEDRQKTGMELKGIMAINPANNEEIPVWVADYVLASYGTGAIMAVPQHDARDREFAEKFNLPIVDRPLVSSDEIIHKVGGTKTVKYKLRDWVFSRQRYWGEPIPLVFCESCKDWIPLPEDQLPLVLPAVEKYQPTDTGESPLAAMTDWVNTTCPRCNGPARRETDTMPNWAGSSWYYLAYTMQGISNFPASTRRRRGEQFPISNYKEIFKYWLPVDWYNGGMEHTTLHLLYSRFWNEFLFDIGVVPVFEPYAKRTSHGMILAENGEKMSKSRGNVVNPDTVVKELGADTLRVYEMFMGPFADAVPWSTKGIIGLRRFLERVWRLGAVVIPAEAGIQADDFLLHQTIKKVSADIEAMKFNTAISQMMILVNAWTKDGVSSRPAWLDFLKLLAPFAPHLAEELWEQAGETGFISLAAWPKYDPARIITETVTLVVQVNGKVRATIIVPTDVPETELIARARAEKNVQQWLAELEPKKTVVIKGRLINFVV